VPLPIVLTCNIITVTPDFSAALSLSVSALIMQTQQDTVFGWELSSTILKTPSMFTRFIETKCNTQASIDTSKGRFTHSMPCPCRAAKGLECVFPLWFTQRARARFTLAIPCPYCAPAMPFFSKPRHSTSVERRPVG